MKATPKIAGILAPLFALRRKNDLGIGDTAALIELLKWASQHGFGAIQLLPINEVGKKNSPYDALSAFALEPSTLTTDPSWIPDLLLKEYHSILSSCDLGSLQSNKVNYPIVKDLKRALLAAAWREFHKKKPITRWRQFLKFEKEEAYWLDDYTLYRALLEHNDDQENFSKWPTPTRQASTAYAWVKNLPPKEHQHLEQRRRFFSYVQWIAKSQWKKVFRKATTLGMILVGDIPIGIHRASADVFSKPVLFDLHAFGGAPAEKVFSADPFTKKWGQNWGIPLHQWNTMAQDDFEWCRHRLRYARSFFHSLRIDHVLGLFRIYTFPWPPNQNFQFTTLTPREAKKRTAGVLPHFKDYADDTPPHRKYNEQRGERLLCLFLEEVGPGGLVAEDLGATPSYVPTVLSRLNIPGFKIPHWFRDVDGRMVPRNKYPYCSLATYATHDHPPLRTQWEDWQRAAQKKGAAATTARKTLHELLQFANLPHLDLFTPYEGKVHQGLLQALYESSSWLAIVMITDLFASTQQFNKPGSSNANNWRERIHFPIHLWNQKYKFILMTSDKALKNCQRFKN
ncbi:MAG: 4-alpha-glucanotransferase [Chthoniobacterales bacterium]|nr:4-alpha-glucanotransferase [Chthoniobacterales bacterium]